MVKSPNSLKFHVNKFYSGQFAFVAFHKVMKHFLSVLLKD